MLDGGRTRSASGEKRRRYLRWGRIAVTVAAVAYLASRVEPRDVLNAFQRLSPGAALTALAVVLFALVCGMVRWRLLLRAYGAIDIPSWPRIAHLYTVGHFYNTYAPGGVGGDVIRGVAGRKAFAPMSQSIRSPSTCLASTAGCISTAAPRGIAAPHRPSAPCP